MRGAIWLCCQSVALVQWYGVFVQFQRICFVTCKYAEEAENLSFELATEGHYKILCNLGVILYLIFFAILSHLSSFCETFQVLIIIFSSVVYSDASLFIVIMSSFLQKFSGNDSMNCMIPDDITYLMLL